MFLLTLMKVLSFCCSAWIIRFRRILEYEDYGLYGFNAQELKYFFFIRDFKNTEKNPQHENEIVKKMYFKVI